MHFFCINAGSFLCTFNVLGGIQIQDSTDAGVAFNYDAIGTLKKSSLPVRRLEVPHVRMGRCNSCNDSRDLGTLRFTLLLLLDSIGNFCQRNMALGFTLLMAGL